MMRRPTSRKGFRWKCPYCGASRLNASEGETGETNAITALQAHIVASDGAGHGPKNETPSDFEPWQLSEYVDRIDGRQ